MIGDCCTCHSFATCADAVVVHRFLWHQYASEPPYEVDQLFRAQLFHDRKQLEERRRMKPDERAKTPVVDAWMA